VAPPKPTRDPGTELVRHLAKILDETGLTEIELEREGLKVRVSRSASPQATFQTGPMATAPNGPSLSLLPSPVPRPAERDGETITSPMVGSVYLQAQPGSPPFVRVGDEVSAGQTLLLVEAMKTMNPIPAPRTGKVLEILVADGQPVEYGEPLMIIE